MRWACGWPACVFTPTPGAGGHEPSGPGADRAAAAPAAHRHADRLRARRPRADLRSRRADAYAEGLWDSPDLVALVRLAARNAALADRPRQRLAPLTRPLRHARALARPATRRRRRRDIAAHYDLGDQLFSRMLDETMTYSCAVFDSPRATLEEAQRAKLELVCRKLELSPQDRVLEIGTGWGSFALHAASTRGCQV